ncbi:MAG: hypothetical protein Tsb0020_36680 [Haliangiales bacterium]
MFSRSSFFSALGAAGAIAIIAAALHLSGCRSLLGSGDEVTRAEVSLEQPFEISYTPDGEAPEQLWLAFDVDYQRDDFQITGPIEIYYDEQLQGRYTLALSHDGAPIAESSARKEIGTREVALNQDRSLSSTVHLLELAAAPGARSVTVRGQWTASDAQVNELVVLVTH